ncbi:MBL fold metallo-hydrolase, partial [Desulfosarcina sp.]|nr:MBL fold metallo-hydrolase [Desulfosarcina sp.]
LKRIMIITISIIAILAISVYIFMQQPKFGKLPSGDRLAKIEQSPNYKNGKFQNLRHTPDLTEGETFFSVTWYFLFAKKPRLKPIDQIPSTKTDLLNLDPQKDILVWFGHSSYFMQIDSKKILVDPVFSGSVSPIEFTSKAFEGTDQYTTDDIPEIDYLFITHDHWDHLDYETVLKLKSKIKKIICGLGTGEHLEYWGFDKNIIIEEDWNEKIILESGFIVHTTPGRHFSGRGFTRNKALWTSFVLKSPSFNLFIGGDSGYDTHFADIGLNYGPFDLVILENGQYDKKWKYIHMMPEEVLQASFDLKAKRLFPVHSSKFAIANHPWDEPLSEITKLNKDSELKLITPIIGEQVNLKDTTQTFTQWWKGIK